MDRVSQFPPFRGVAGRQIQVQEHKTRAQSRLNLERYS